MLKKSTFIIVIILALSATYHAVYAQTVPGTLTSVRYSGIAFNYRPEALGTVLPSYDPGTAYQVDAPYFANVAPHISFKFLRPDPIYPDIDLVAELRIYRILDLQAYP